MNKRGVIGSAFMMVYRMLLLTFIAFVIFGLSAFFYEYRVDVRNLEARLINYGLADCLFSSGSLDLDRISNEKILDYCGYGRGELGRLYTSLEVSEVKKTGNKILSKKVFETSQGDSGKGWALVLKKLANSGEWKRHFPGDSGKIAYPIIAKMEGRSFDASASIRVVVGDEG